MAGFTHAGSFYLTIFAMMIGTSLAFRLKPSNIHRQMTSHFMSTAVGTRTSPKKLLGAEDLLSKTDVFIFDCGNE